MATWSTQQLVEFLAGISACRTEASALRDAVDRAAEALDAEIAAVVQDDTVIASTGFASGQVPEGDLAAVANGAMTTIAVPGVGTCETVAVALSDPAQGCFVVGRAGTEPFDHEDISVFRGMARVLALTLAQLRLIESERTLRERSEREASERRAAQQELAHQVRHDALTGLPNRTLLLDRLDDALARARHEETMVAVLFIDLDNFKLINDTLGHHVGDDLLRMVAGRLRDSVRLQEPARPPSADTVARFGGDEFVLLSEGLTDTAGAEMIASRIAMRLAAPFEIGGEKLYVTASTGVAMSCDASTPNALIRDADAAMYHAKARGPARSEVFDDAMRGRLLKRVSREKELRAAIAREEFFLDYQPIFATAERAIVGAEALIRWQHPEKGVLAPAEFIPVAEETGLITQIDHWVLRHVCMRLARWQQSGATPPDFGISINLSARQVKEGGLPDAVRLALAESGVEPRSLGLEITETVLIESTDSPIAVLESLRESGARLVLDDFGTGYSSLSYLQRLPIDALKLDRSFITAIASAGRDRDIVAALLHLARVLGLDVVAEGVETEAQLQCLAQMRCRFVQGFHLGRPLSEAKLHASLSKTRRQPLRPPADLPQPARRRAFAS